MDPKGAKTHWGSFKASGLRTLCGVPSGRVLGIRSGPVIVPRTSKASCRRCNPLRLDAMGAFF